MFVGNLPVETSEEDIRNLFSDFGKVRSIHLITDIFTRKCRGFGFVEMEGHEARAAIQGLNGKSFGGKMLKVKYEEERSPRGNRRR